MAQRPTPSDYAHAFALAKRRTRSALVGPETEIGAALIRAWLSRYSPRCAEIVSLDTKGFHYLFDISTERLIAAWGVSRGRALRARDAARIRGYPLGVGPGYHRGHAIAHTLGGGEDVNLQAQRARINVGAFRRLERLAVQSADALYFTHWIYAGYWHQVAAIVEQGLLILGQRPLLARHHN